MANIFGTSDRRDCFRQYNDEHGQYILGYVMVSFGYLRAIAKTRPDGSVVSAVRGGRFVRSFDRLLTADELISAADELASEIIETIQWQIIEATQRTAKGVRHD